MAGSLFRAAEETSIALGDLTARVASAIGRTSELVGDLRTAGEALQETSFIENAAKIGANISRDVDLGEGAAAIMDIGETSQVTGTTGAGLMRGTSGITTGAEGLRTAETATGFHLPPAFSTRSATAKWVQTVSPLAETASSAFRTGDTSTSLVRSSEVAGDLSRAATAGDDAFSIGAESSISLGSLETSSSAGTQAGLLSDVGAFTQMTTSTPRGTLGRFFESIPLLPWRTRAIGAEATIGAGDISRIAADSDEISIFSQVSEAESELETSRETFFTSLNGWRGLNVGPLCKWLGIGAAGTVTAAAVGGVFFGVYYAIHQAQLPPTVDSASPAPTSGSAAAETTTSTGPTPTSTPSPAETLGEVGTHNTKTPSHAVRPANSGGKVNPVDTNLQPSGKGGTPASVKFNNNQDFILTPQFHRFLRSLSTNFLRAMSHIDLNVLMRTGVYQWRKTYIPDGTVRMEWVFELPTNMSLGALEKDWWLTKTYGNAADLVEAVLQGRRRTVTNRNKRHAQDLNKTLGDVHKRISRDLTHAKLTGSSALASDAPGMDDDDDGGVGYYTQQFQTSAASPPVYNDPNYIFHSKGYTTTANLQYSRLPATAAKTITDKLDLVGNQVGKPAPPSSTPSVVDDKKNVRKQMLDEQPFPGKVKWCRMQGDFNGNRFMSYIYGLKPWLHVDENEMPKDYGSDVFGGAAELRPLKDVEKFFLFEPVRTYLARNPIVGFYGSWNQNKFPTLYANLNLKTGDMTILNVKDTNADCFGEMMLALDEHPGSWIWEDKYTTETSADGCIMDLCWWYDLRDSDRYFKDYTTSASPPAQTVGKNNSFINVKFINWDPVANTRTVSKTAPTSIHMKDIEFVECYIRMLGDRKVTYPMTTRAQGTADEVSQFHLPVSGKDEVKNHPAFLAMWIQAMLYRFCQSNHDVTHYTKFNKLCWLMAKNFRYEDLVSWFGIKCDWQTSTISEAEMAYWLQIPVLTMLLDRAVGSLETTANHKWIGLVTAVQYGQMSNYTCFQIAAHFGIKLDVKSSDILLPVPIPEMPPRGKFEQLPINFKESMRFLLSASSNLMLLEQTAAIKQMLYNQGKFEPADFGKTYRAQTHDYLFLTEAQSDALGWNDSTMVIAPFIFKPNWGAKSYHGYRIAREWHTDIHDPRRTATPRWGYAHSNPFFFDIETEDPGTYEELLDFMEMLEQGNVHCGFVTDRETKWKDALSGGPSIFIQMCPWTCGQQLNVDSITEGWLNDQYKSTYLDGDFFKDGCSWPIYPTELPTNDDSDWGKNSMAGCFLIVTQYGNHKMTTRKPTILECFTFIWGPDLALKILRTFAVRYSMTKLLLMSTSEQSAQEVFFNLIVRNLEELAAGAAITDADYYRPDAPIAWGTTDSAAWGAKLWVGNKQHDVIHSFDHPMFKMRVIKNDNYIKTHDGPSYPWKIQPDLHYRWFLAYTSAPYLPLCCSDCPDDKVVVWNTPEETVDASLEITNQGSSAFLDAFMGGIGPFASGLPFALDIQTDKTFISVGVVYHDEVASRRSQVFERKNYMCHVPGVEKLSAYKSASAAKKTEMAGYYMKLFSVKQMYPDSLQQYFDVKYGPYCLNYNRLTRDMAWDKFFTPGMDNLMAELNKHH
ncbi:TPA_asm: hypothetical protein 3 [Varicolored abalone xenomavirus]|nr:TPA_asm: hypothetical protein 3 [Varicolored abalone xenomavirus]